VTEPVCQPRESHRSENHARLLVSLELTETQRSELALLFPWLLFHEALQGEPVGEVVDPVIGGDVLSAHAEAVAARGIHVEFGGLFGFGPLLVEGDAVRGES
jgi:hypothetical protein